MAVTLSQFAGVGVQLFDNNGVPLAGGKIYTYQAGTTTPLATYTTNLGNVARTNPIILDAAGRVPGGGEIWVTSGVGYKFLLATSTDVPIATYDNVPSSASPVVANDADNIQYEQGYTVTAGGFVTGKTYQIVTVGTTDFTLIGATSNTVGLYFTATGAGTGDGTAQLSQTVATKLRQYVSVKDFGAVGNGSTNDTTAVQAAINSGLDIYFPAGNYAVGGLTQSTNFQRFYAQGQANLVKNANGVLFTSSGDYVEFNGLQFIGTGYSGNNINSTGSNPRFINCSSYGTPGRAIKATGGHVEVIGTSGIYATTDSSATGYDIEIGVSGTATLYHQLYGVYSGQATGGILLIDTGSHSIVGGQFGKLTIQSGTAPAGSNGGMTANARILGDVSVQLSNSVFTGNQFSTQTITFAAGTSQHSLNESNLTTSATIVNNGNSNAPIIKSVGTGSPVGIVLQYGSDSFNSTIRYSDNEIFFTDSNLNLANNNAVKFADSGGTFYTGLSLSSGDDWQFGANNGANFTNVNSGSVGIIFNVGGTNIAQCTSTAFRASSDGVPNLGGASNRWNTVFATNGTINTSDVREKQDVADLNAAEKRVAIALKGLVKKFRFRDAVAVKGDAARIHVGVIAQDVVTAFNAEGLDALRYGIICYDEWAAEPAVLDPNTNAVVTPAKAAGSRYGVRYDEMLAFIIGAL